MCTCPLCQVEVIKKAYNQESECEGVEVEASPREVGHNIYILAQQVTKLNFLLAIGKSSWYFVVGLGQNKVLDVFLQLARHNKVLHNLLKPQKNNKEGEEGISSMVNIHPYMSSCNHLKLTPCCCLCVCSWTWTTDLCPRCWSPQLQLLWWSRTRWSTTSS